MKVKDDFLLREVAGCYVVVPVGQNAVDFNGIVNLNETGAFFWEMLQNDITEQELLAAVLDKYEVDEKTAKADIKSFIAKLEENDLLA